MKKLKDNYKKIIIIMLVLIIGSFGMFKFNESSKEEKKQNLKIQNEKINNILKDKKTKEFEGYLQGISKDFTSNKINYEFTEKQYSKDEYTNLVLKSKKQTNPINVLKLIGNNDKDLDILLIKDTNHKFKIKYLELHPDIKIIYEVDNYKISDKELRDLIIEIYGLK